MKPVQNGKSGKPYTQASSSHGGAYGGGRSSVKGMRAMRPGYYGQHMGYKCPNDSGKGR